MLIAFRSSPGQSAPTVEFATIAGTRGWAEQSFVADSSSVPPSILGRLQTTLAITTTVSTTVLSETHVTFRRRGLTLLLVIGGGLWLGECLDVTVCVGQNVPAETHPLTFVRNAGDHRSGSPTPGDPRRIRTLGCLHRQLLRIKEFSFLPQPQGHRDDLPRQGHLRQIVLDASSQ